MSACNGLTDPGDAELAAAEASAAAEPSAGVGNLDDPKAAADPETARLAALSLVHGIATLWLNHAVPRDEPEALVRRLGLMLFDEGGC